MPIPNKILLTGNIYIKYLDDSLTPYVGDILLLLNDEKLDLAIKNYEDSGFSGYIRAKIYDGKIWQHIDIFEFCVNKENKLIKKQRVIDSLLLCREILANHKNTIMHKTYRGHFTSNIYEPEPYIRKIKYAKPKTRR